MEIGIFAKTFRRPDLETTLDAVVASSLTTMQFNLALAGGVSLPDAIPAAAIREQVERRGLTMAAVSGTYNMAHPDSAVRVEGRRRLRELIAAASALGTRVVTLCTGSRDAADMWRHHPDNRSPQAWRDLLESLEDALTAAEQHAVTLAFEPEHNNVIDSAVAGWRLLDEVRSRARPRQGRPRRRHDRRGRPRRPRLRALSRAAEAIRRAADPARPERGRSPRLRRVLRDASRLRPRFAGR
jgi:sugar phosphate isomerase/epimerase